MLPALTHTQTWLDDLTGPRNAVAESDQSASATTPRETTAQRLKTIGDGGSPRPARAQRTSLDFWLARRATWKPKPAHGINSAKGLRVARPLNADGKIQFTR